MITVPHVYDSGSLQLCVTVDAPYLGRREADEQNCFALPEGLTLANLVSDGDSNLPTDTGRSGLFSYFQDQIDPGLTWQDIEWLRSITTLPIVIKGIQRADDAQLAVEHGAQAIVISNHGGRQLDGAISTLEALPAIVEAVGEQITLLMDGGIRRGTDIFKAIALGAEAVLVGRPILWGLSAEGQTGVEKVLAILRDELDLAMALSGCNNLKEINRSFVIRS